MKNKLLSLIVVILVPFVVISFRSENEKTNFYLTEIKGLKASKENELTRKVRVKDSKNDVVTEMDLDEYLVGVVASEMPASFHIEALKTQAVAARSYAIYKMGKSSGSYDVVTDVSNQGFITVDEMKEKWQSDFYKYYEKIKNAVYDTHNEIITFNNNVIEAFYFSMSNGYTEDASLVFSENEPYLVSVASKWDNESLRGFNAELILPNEKFLKKLGLSGNIVINDIERSSTNRVNKITINNMEFIGTKFRKLLDLRSTDFDITLLEGKVKITTHGYGHGVGLSQYGANGMAKEGYKYNDIIPYYYKGTEITKI